MISSQFSVILFFLFWPVFAKLHRFSKNQKELLILPPHFEEKGWSGCKISRLQMVLLDFYFSSVGIFYQDQEICNLYFFAATFSERNESFGAQNIAIQMILKGRMIFGLNLLVLTAMRSLKQQPSASTWRNTRLNPKEW